MNDKRNFEGKLVPDKQPLTLFGKYVGKFSLDKLPKVINVFKGKRSLIDPRPLLHKFIPSFTTDQTRRHEVYSGITGWAQLIGRDRISWTRKFELDVSYMTHISLSLDFKIFRMTILRIVQRKMELTCPKTSLCRHLMERTHAV